MASRAHYRIQYTSPLPSQTKWVLIGPIDYEALKNENATTYDSWKSYGRSKLSNIIFTYALHKTKWGQERGPLHFAE